MRALAPLALAALLAPAQLALAQEFREVGAGAAVLYDGPSERAAKRFIVVRGTPLEVVSQLGAWVKVRDYAGDVLWIAQADLAAQSRSVVVSRALASVRRSPRDVGELLFQAERGVLLEVVDDSAPEGWLRVRHRDGTAGFVSAGEVWGR